MAPAPEAEQEGSSRWRAALQTVGLFIVVQFVMRQIVPSPQKTSSAATNSTVATAKPIATEFSSRAAFDEIQDIYSPVPQFISPIWSTEESIDLTISVSASPKPTFPESMHSPFTILAEKDLKISKWDDSRDIHTVFLLPPGVSNNGTLWAHIFVASSGSQLDPLDADYDPTRAFHFVRPLTQYLKKKKARKTRNLLSDTEGTEDEGVNAEQEARPEISAFYHPNFTLSIIPDSGMLSYPAVHPAIREWINLDTSGSRDETGKNGWYYPLVYLNTFWQLRDYMQEVNTTVTQLPINIHLNRLANWKFNIITSLDFSVKQNQQKAAAGQSLPGGGDGSEFEEMKRILLDSNSYLLGTTVVVGIFHTIFEMLAFKNDVSHWRNKKDNVGVSVRTILANVFMQTIIFLYLIDNTENTSWMILLGQGMGILLEAWKITRTVDVRVRPTPEDSTAFPWRFLPYTIVFEDKHKLSETERKTQEYDQIAFKYLYWVAVPLLVAYAIYSLLYETHKSWYSFIITTLVGSVYAYGFLMMVPTLYINYRLKSVAHMPGKAMTYKVLNTFIDDLFAFTVKMPTLHRLATLRDDVIFFVYLYQSWKYKVDYTRVNEFGQGGEEEEVSEKLANEPTKSPAGGQTKALPSSDKAETTGAEVPSAKKRK